MGLSKRRSKRLYAADDGIFAGFGGRSIIDGARADAAAALPDATIPRHHIMGDNGSSAEGGLDGEKTRPLLSMVCLNVAEQSEDIEEAGWPEVLQSLSSGMGRGDGHAVTVDQAGGSHFGGTRIRDHLWPAKITDKAACEAFHPYGRVPTIFRGGQYRGPRNAQWDTAKAIEGVSMVYTLQRCKARIAERARSSNSSPTAVLPGGWMASSLAFVPWQPVRNRYDPDKAKWELYHIDQDFSQADDLAAQYPEKLRHPRLWCRSGALKIFCNGLARRRRLSDQLTGSEHRSRSQIHSSMETPIVALAGSVGADLKNKSFIITAEAEVPSSAATA